MGSPSDRTRSAQRPGKRERARAKKRRRGSHTVYVGGAGTYSLTAGRKHLKRFGRWTWSIARENHLSGNQAGLPKADKPDADGLPGCGLASPTHA